MDAFVSTDPSTGDVIARYPYHDQGQLDKHLDALAAGQQWWSEQSPTARAATLQRMGRLLTEGRRAYARLMVREMGKPITEALAEIDKCAWACRQLAADAPAWLAPEVVATEAQRTEIRPEPLGVLLAIMPWNFPFWQVFRCATGAWMAGNTVALKHAPTVGGCAAAIETLVAQAAGRDDLLRSIRTSNPRAEALIADHRIAAVALTGSTAAGRAVAAAAGRALKKCVLELGGSDPFLVFADANLDKAVEAACRSRFLNAGQSCIAAKRIFVEAPIFESFCERLREAVATLRVGDPMDETTTLGPLARRDLRDALDRQVRESLALGAVDVAIPVDLPSRGWYSPPRILREVTPRMPVAREETFGPVACVATFSAEDEAIDAANDSAYGLGAAVFTADADRARRVGRAIRSGTFFANAMVRSDPRLPFGGVKASGHGRELSRAGVMEFVNLRSWWLDPA